MNQEYNDFRVYLEGVRVPCAGVRRQQGSSTYSFIVNIPLTPVGMSVLPGTYVTVFKRQARSRGHQWILFAEGRVTGRNMALSQQTSSLNLTCESLDAEWMRTKLGMSIGQETGFPRPRLMHFFEGLSAREEAEAPVENFEAIRNSKFQGVVSEANQQLLNSMVSFRLSIMRQMIRSGPVRGLASVVAGVYQYSPLLLRTYNSYRMGKRFGFVENEAITKYLERDLQIDQITFRIQELPGSATLQQVIDEFLAISMHSYTTIASPYFNRDLYDEKKEGEEVQAELETEEAFCKETDRFTRMEEAEDHPRVKALLDIIGMAEVGGDPDAPYSAGKGYYKMVGGRTLSPSTEHPAFSFTKRKDNGDRVPDYSKYPFLVTLESGSSKWIYPAEGEEIPEGAVYVTYGDNNTILRSSASGRYQITYGTWREAEAYLGTTIPFTPPGQDRAAIALLDKLGALQAICEGDIDRAIQLAAGKWASLPLQGSTGIGEDKGNQKPHFTSREARAAYEERLRKQGGNVAAVQDSAGLMPSMVFLPDFPSAPPPMCNVVMGAVISANASETFTRAPTRTMTIARPEISATKAGGNHMIGLFNMLHFAPRHIQSVIDVLRQGNPTSDLILPKEVSGRQKEQRRHLEQMQGEIEKLRESGVDEEDLEGLVERGKTYEQTLQSAAEEDIYNALIDGDAQILEDNLLNMATYQELFQGIQGRMVEFPYYESNGQDEYAASIYSSMAYQRFSRAARGLNFTCKPNPDLAPGFTAAVHHETFGWVVGRLSQVSDNYAADGSATTSGVLKDCQFLGDYDNPYWERIHRENESEFATLDEDGNPVSGKLIDDDLASDKIGESMYQPILGCDSVIDFVRSNRQVEEGEEDVPSLREALAFIRGAYHNQKEPESWLRRVTERPIATQKEFMEGVLEANLREDGTYGPSYPVATIPQEEVFVEERQDWAATYAGDIAGRMDAIDTSRPGSNMDDYDGREEAEEKWKKYVESWKDREEVSIDLSDVLGIVSWEEEAESFTDTLPASDPEESILFDSGNTEENSNSTVN